ncbi:MAG TPA: hypothetical protein VFZ65_13175 [Planctomycetota bacterium]|nr:hypothetical protein [Planctomycetota bacterium]
MKGETVQVELQPDLDAPVLTALLLAPGAVARADTRVEVEMDFTIDESRYRKQFSGSSDSRGRFRLPLPSYLVSVHPSDLLISVVDCNGEKIGPVRRVQCPTFGSGETVELGDVVLSRPALLVTLHLHDVQGGHCWAWHQIQTLEEDASGAKTWVEWKPEFREELSDGGIAYFAHDLDKRWRVSFRDPRDTYGDLRAFAGPVEFDAGTARLDVVRGQTSR